MDKVIEMYKKRWVEIEERYSHLLSILSELDEMNEIPEVEEQISLKHTKAYMLINKEMEVLAAEQRLIEKSGILSMK